VQKRDKGENVVLTAGGRHYLHAVIQIEKQTEGDARNVIMAAFAAHTSLKHVVVVDEDIDVYDTDDIEFAIATRVKGDLDIMVIPNVRGSSSTRALEATARQRRSASMPPHRWSIIGSSRGSVSTRFSGFRSAFLGAARECARELRGV